MNRIIAQSVERYSYEGEVTGSSPVNVNNMISYICDVPEWFKGERNSAKDIICTVEFESYHRIFNSTIAQLVAATDL